MTFIYVVCRDKGIIIQVLNIWLLIMKRSRPFCYAR